MLVEFINWTSEIRLTQKLLGNRIKVTKQAVTKPESEPSEIWLQILPTYTHFNFSDFFQKNNIYTNSFYQSLQLWQIIT